MSRARFAIAFDIDGVLWRSPDVFPFSKPTLQRVINANIPHVFLTNWGGKTEPEIMQILNHKLEMDMHHSHLVLCHTPLRKHLQQHSKDTILLSGNRDIYNVGLEYGWSECLTTGEIVSAHPNVWPFESSHKQLELETARRHKESILHFDPSHVSAIAILNHGTCWGSEIQLILDALLYGEKTDENGKHPQFYYTNADLVWMTNYKHPRFAQGVYVGMIQDTYKRLTGNEINAVQFGKPSKFTFDYAKDVLLNEANKLGFDGIEQLYMIGDHPHGDIVGANKAGWKSVLVKTGVYQHGKDDAHDPTIILENVQEAVEWIVNQH